MCVALMCAMALECAAQTPIHFALRQCTGSARDRQVTIIPLDGPKGFYGTNIVDDAPISFWSTNGVADTNLVIGNYLFRFSDSTKSMQIFWPEDPSITNAADPRIQRNGLTLVYSSHTTNPLPAFVLTNGGVGYSIGGTLNGAASTASTATNIVSGGSVAGFAAVSLNGGNALRIGNGTFLTLDETNGMNGRLTFLGDIAAAGGFIGDGSGLYNLPNFVVTNDAVETVRFKALKVDGADVMTKGQGTNLLQVTRTNDGARGFVVQTNLDAEFWGTVTAPRFAGDGAGLTGVTSLTGLWTNWLRVVCIGDSLTEGNHVGGLAWPWWLANAVWTNRYHFAGLVNLGIHSDTITNMAYRLSTNLDLIASSGGTNTAVICLGGVNDFALGVSWQTAWQAWSNMVVVAHTNGARFFAMTVADDKSTDYPSDAFQTNRLAFNQAILASGIADGAYDLAADYLSLSNRTVDGIHFTTNENRQIARKIGSRIESGFLDQAVPGSQGSENVRVGSLGVRFARPPEGGIGVGGAAVITGPLTLGAQGTQLHMTNGNAGHEVGLFLGSSGVAAFADPTLTRGITFDLSGRLSNYGTAGWGITGPADISGNVSAGGTYSGDGSGLTNLPAGQLTGTVAAGTLATNGMLPNAVLQATGTSRAWTGNPVITNLTASGSGSFSSFTNTGPTYLSGSVGIGVAGGGPDSYWAPSKTVHVYDTVTGYPGLRLQNATKDMSIVVDGDDCVLWTASAMGYRWYTASGRKMKLWASGGLALGANATYTDPGAGNAVLSGQYINTNSAPPAAALTGGQAYVWNSNSVIYLLTSAPGSTAWAATNKLGP